MAKLYRDRSRFTHGWYSYQPLQQATAHIPPNHQAGEIGNGRATAICLARQGAKVALVDYNVARAEETQHMISLEGLESSVIQADVTDDASCTAAVAKTVELFDTVPTS